MYHHKSLKCIISLLFIASQATVLFAQTSRAETSVTTDAKAMVIERDLCSHRSGAEFLRMGDLLAGNKSQSCSTQVSGISTRVEDLQAQQELRKPDDVNQGYQVHIVPPRVVDEGKIHRGTTSMPINGVMIDHLTETRLSLGYDLNDISHGRFNVNRLVKLKGVLRENLTVDNVLTVEQTGEYLQLQTARRNREVTVTFKQPQTVLGTNLQLSITGSCIFPGSDSESICTYVPALTSENINSETLLPSRIFQTATVGNVVDSATVEEIRKPNFQSGLKNGQQIGIDLSIPNTGSFAGNSNGEEISIIRGEEIESTAAATYSLVRQVVKMNNRETVLGRTVRGFSVILDDNNNFLNSGLHLGYNLMPDVLPTIDGEASHAGQSGSSLNYHRHKNLASPQSRRRVNRNLFLAANNARIPPNSLTGYHGGIARANHISPEARTLSEVPAARFNSVWLGASPVIKRVSRITTRFEDVGNLRILSSQGVEGGSESNIDFLSNINNQTFSPANVPSFYAQIYVSIFDQEATNITTSKYREEIIYVPHLSFTGNVTRARDVFRYYTGVIGDEEIQGYTGIDYTINTADKWSFYGSVIGYVNPDIDQYSQVRGAVSKDIALQGNNNLLVGAGVSYGFDREYRPNDAVNFMNMSARARLGDMWLGVTNYFGDVLQDAVAHSFLTTAGVKISNNLLLSGYYNPINENAASSLYGVDVTWRIGKTIDSPTLKIAWNSNQYKYSEAENGQELQINENILRIFLRGNF